MSAQERTGWRDEWISRRHRDWGYNVPCVDIDFLLVEFDSCEPVAIIDYKRQDPENVKQDYGVRALTRLADRASLPAFIVAYTIEPIAFTAIPLNAMAHSALDRVWQGLRSFSEQEWRATLHALRGRDDEAVSIISQNNNSDAAPRH